MRGSSLYVWSHRQGTGVGLIYSSRSGQPISYRKLLKYMSLLVLARRVHCSVRWLDGGGPTVQTTKGKSTKKAFTKTRRLPLATGGFWAARRPQICDACDHMATPSWPA
jgi:hypothetical protein